MSGSGQVVVAIDGRRGVGVAALLGLWWFQCDGGAGGGVGVMVNGIRLCRPRPGGSAEVRVGGSLRGGVRCTKARTSRHHVGPGRGPGPGDRSASRPVADIVCMHVPCGLVS